MAPATISNGHIAHLSSLWLHSGLEVERGEREAVLILPAEPALQIADAQPSPTAVASLQGREHER
jgi:hypothetical protein